MLLKYITPNYIYRYSTKELMPISSRVVFGVSQLAKNIDITKNIWAEKGKIQRPVLPCFFGLDTSRQVVTRDFIDIRQLLITGIQGSGKTTALHVLLSSMMHLTNPELLRIHLFDPKKDLYPYKGLLNYHHGHKSYFLETLNNIEEERKVVLS